MVLRQVGALGRARAEADEAWIEDAHEVALQQRLARDGTREVVGDADSDVDLTGGERVLDDPEVDRAAHDAHARRFGLE